MCPYPGYSALGTAAYGLLLSLLAIATLVIYVIRYNTTYQINHPIWVHNFILTYSARFSRVLSHRNSFEGIWLLSIITYKYTADTCFNLLRCQKVSANEISGEFVRVNIITIPSLIHLSTHHRCTITMDLFDASIQIILLFPLLPYSWELLLCFSSQY